MKKFLLSFFVFVLSFFHFFDARAHTIGGAYASLVSCKWGQLGYEYGYIGTYNVNGQMISQFFGSNYCPF